jgi:serine/threonine-protein kinase
MLLLSLSPVVAGRTGPLKFAVAMVGPSLEEARQVVEQVAAQVAGMLPESIELGVTIVKAEPKRPGRTLID